MLWGARPLQPSAMSALFSPLSLNLPWPGQPVFGAFPSYSWRWMETGSSSVLGAGPGTDGSSSPQPRDY